MTTARASILVALAFIASLTLYASPSAASEPAGSSTDRSAAEDAQIHCVAKAYPIGQSPAVVPPAVCFDTFGAAIAYATGGAVQIPDVTSRQLSEAEMAPNGTLGSTIIGIDYTEAQHTGSTFFWNVDDPNGCLAGAKWQATEMPAGWNDVVSSAYSYQGCDYWYHYEHTGLWGSRLACTCYSMGIMDNLTSSEFWSNTPTP